MSSGESTCRTADRSFGWRDWITRDMTSLADGCVLEEAFVPSAHKSARVESNVSANERIGAGEPSPYYKNRDTCFGSTYRVNSGQTYVVGLYKKDLCDGEEDAVREREDETS